MSRYEEAYLRSQESREAFWAEAAEEIRSRLLDWIPEKFQEHAKWRSKISQPTQLRWKPNISLSFFKTAAYLHQIQMQRSLQ